MQTTKHVIFFSRVPLDLGVNLPSSSSLRFVFPGKLVKRYQTPRKATVSTVIRNARNYSHIAITTNTREWVCCLGLNDQKHIALKVFESIWRHNSHRSVLIQWSGRSIHGKLVNKTHSHLVSFISELTSFLKYFSPSFNLDRRPGPNLSEMNDTRIERWFFRFYHTLSSSPFVILATYRVKNCERRSNFCKLNTQFGSLFSSIQSRPFRKKNYAQYGIFSASLKKKEWRLYRNIRPCSDG